jgi:hypothetical protein
MLKWKPRLRLVLALAVLIACAYALGWFELANFLEW